MPAFSQKNEERQTGRLILAPTLDGIDRSVIAFCECDFLNTFANKVGENLLF